MRQITIAEKTYDVDEDGKIEGANASCHAEQHLSHPYCYLSPTGFEDAEEADEIFRQFSDGWYWFVCEKEGAVTSSTT